MQVLFYFQIECHQINKKNIYHIEAIRRDKKNILRGKYRRIICKNIKKVGLLIEMHFGLAFRSEITNTSTHISILLLFILSYQSTVFNVSLIFFS